MLRGVQLMAGPEEFGQSELERAIRDRGFTGAHLNTEIRPGSIAAEGYELSGNRLMASDSRGLMYGLLEAAEQIRRDGRLMDRKEAPSVQMRGIRVFLHNEDLERSWYYSREYWDDFFAMLARDRFNRFNLVFAHQTDYLAPPYPFWVDIPEFPAIRARHLSDQQRRKNLEMLQFISQDAADHGIDFTLGIWEHNIQSYRKPPMIPMTDGLTRENIGPYSYAALKKVLQLCPAIQSVQMRTNNESGIPNDQQVDFYRNYVFRAIHDAGRPVILDLRGWGMASGMLKAASEAGITARLSSKYWAEDIGRPYQPAETYAGYSYLDFLKNSRPYKFYWELWALGSNRLLLWGSPSYVQRAVSTFSLGGAEGFEIDPPLAQKGFGNAPGTWGVFTAAQQRRVFWKWEFERYWLFYRLWGRLSYDPQTTNRAWMDDMAVRFGGAAKDVMAAYEVASQVVPEIVAVHLADPNMYLWPEINPGGLIDSYRGILPSDWQYVASIPEAVHNRLTRYPSAKQTAPETAARFEAMAADIDNALHRAEPRVKSSAEWLSTEPDLRVLALMARYHARKQLAAYHLELFDQTADESSLRLAKQEVEAGLAIWQKLVALTDGLYPAEMSFGPDDKGDWKDKLPYVQYDLKLVGEREAIFQQFGKFTVGFDFGGPVKHEANPRSYRANNYVLQNNVAPRFQPVDAATQFDAQKGYGWLTDSARTETGIPLTPYLEVRGAAKDPKNLPRDVLFRDFIRGTGDQKFGVKVDPGEYQVALLHPDHTTSELKLAASNGRLEIPMPAGEWSVSGIVVRTVASKKPGPLPGESKPLPRPVFRHDTGTRAQPGQPLPLRLSISNTAHVSRVRLHYRPLNQLAEFKTIEKPPGEEFIIPGSDISGDYDLMYYFEILNDVNGGWFQPNPAMETPYYILKTAS
jgi:hypothetical protein